MSFYYYFVLLLWCFTQKLICGFWGPHRSSTKVSSSLFYSDCFLVCTFWLNSFSLMIKIAASWTTFFDVTTSSSNVFQYLRQCDRGCPAWNSFTVIVHVGRLFWSFRLKIFYTSSKFQNALSYICRPGVPSNQHSRFSWLTNIALVTLHHKL